MAATRSGGGARRAAGAELSLGARAQTPSGLVGTVRFIGPVQFSAGTWVGIELESPAGKNDGSVNGVRYFETATNHGVFVKENQATVLAAAASPAAPTATPTATPTSLTPSEESTASASTATTAGGRTTARSRLAELKEKRDAVLQKANKLTATATATTSTRASLSAAESSTGTGTGLRRLTPTNATRPPRASLGFGAAAPASGSLRASLGVGGATTTTTTAARRASLAPTSGSLSRLPAPSSSTAPRALAGSGSSSSSSSLPSAGGSRRASLTAGATPRASLGGRGAPPATIQEERGAADEAAAQQFTKDGGGGETLAASFAHLRVDTSVAQLPVVPRGEEEEEEGEQEGGDFQFTGDADGADRIVNLSLSGSGSGGTGTGAGGSGSEAGSGGVRIGRMSIYNMGRRISLGGREGDLSSQVNGLRMLLDRKNAELEALRAKAEEGQAALQAGAGLRARAEAAEAAAAAKGEEATRLGLEAERLRAALAEEEGRRRAREAEEGQIGEEAARYRSRCQELEAKGEEQVKKLVELEAEVRALTAKAQHAQEEEKGKWAELAREKAAVATGARRVAELEAQVASLNDMVELLSLDKEKLLLDQELLEERVEELSLELETAKLELEHAATASPVPSPAGADEGGGADVAALAEQNGRLRAALKRLQELSAHEKAELLRRQRELEREVARMEGAERQARELREWKAVKEQELEELHEMVEAAQAFDSMVESLTTKNLELEERMADLRVAVSELEIAQELSEELEAQQAAEAQALRRDVARLSVQLSEREHALRQAEMRVGDQERALARLRGLAKELAAERDGLRGEVAQGTTALGQVRDQAKGVLGQVQALRAQAERLRAAGMAAARARIEAAAAGVRAARLVAWLPRAAVEREAAALEGELTLGRVAGKVEVAWQQLADGAAAALALAQGSGANHTTRHAESPVERLDRAAHEGRVVHALGRAQRLAHFLLLRVRHPSRALPPERALVVAAEAASLLGPVERGVDEVLGVLQEEGGVPEAHSPLSQLEERIAEAEAGLSLHRYGDGGEEGDGGADAAAVTRGLWAQATAHAQLRAAPLLAMLLAGQAYTVATEQGLLPPPPENDEAAAAPVGVGHAPQAEALLERLADLARTGAPRHVGRCLAAAAALDEYHAASAPAEALDPVLNATGRLLDDYATAAAALRDMLGTSPASPSGDARFQGSLRSLVAAWEGMLAALPSNAVPALEAVVESPTGEPAGPLLLALLGEGEEGMAAAQAVRARLEAAVTMGPLLEAARESERALGQALRDKEREEEALRAQVDSLEELLQRAAVRDEAAEEAHEEMSRLLEEKERLEQETEVLSEALEVVQQQADALESENKRLKSLQSVTSPVAAGPIFPSQSAAQPHPTHLQQQPQDMPLVAAAALAAMHRALRHAGREMGYWRAAATRQGLLHGLQPLAASPTTTCAARSPPPPPPEAAGRGAEAEEEARAQLRRTLQEVNRLAARVHSARCAPRVVRLRLAGGRGKEEKGTIKGAAAASGSAARDACVRGEVEAGRLAMDYRRLREEVEQVLGAYRAAAATAAAPCTGTAQPASFIRKAPVLDIAGAKGATVAGPRLVGRVRVRSSMATEKDQHPQPQQQLSRPQCIPVLVGNHHLRVLAERFGVLA